MPDNSQHFQDIKRGAFNFLLLVIGMLYTVFAVYLDAVIIGHRVPEKGVTELSQEFFLLLTSLMFAHLAVTVRERRGFLILVSGFFLSMLLRELDGYLDHIVHGFWKFPAFFIVFLSLATAAKYRDSVLPAMADAARSVSFGYILTGLAILFFFKSVFGSGDFWEAILKADHIDVSEYTIKNVVQEGIELLSYVIILFGAAQFWLAMKPRNA